MIHHHRRGQGAPATAHFGRRHDGRLTAEHLDFEEEAVTGNRDFKAQRTVQAQREGRYEVKTGYTAHVRPDTVVTETVDILNAWDARMGAWRPVPPGPVYDLAVDLIRRGELTCRIVGLLPLTGSQDEVLILREVREKRVWSVTLGCEVRVTGNQKKRWSRV